MLTLYKKDKGNKMKKFFYFLIMIFIIEKIYCANFVNWADYYLYRYKENGKENYFPFFFQNLKEKYGIKVFIYKDNEKNVDLREKSEKIHTELKELNKEKILLLIINYYHKQGKILVDDDLIDILGSGNIEILEKEILNKFAGRWYINELNLFTKIIGTFYYILEKKDLNKADIKKLKPEIIFIDDLLFTLSMKKPFSDILNLFYFEPISFVFYFPFITYFIIVRIIGYNFGINGLRMANIIWGLFMLFIAILIYNRMYIILPEYVSLFLLFCGLSTPIYIYFYFIYKEEIQCALYEYFNKITGGFNESIFQKD